MKNIKIFVTHTPKRSDDIIENEIFHHIIAGSVYDKTDSHFLKDNTGIHISEKNKSYCELTTQYWAWKNIEADYYGFFHYRRYLSFSEETFKEDGWGTVATPFLTKDLVKKLCLEPENIHQTVESYDCLIAKGIPTMALNGFRTVREHYKGASELHVKDLDAVIKILERDYPYLKDAAQRYINGGIFYPCNVFVMKKELFQQYSELLFDILQKFEQESDMAAYSREGYRTTGHLGERILGIFYTYLKDQKTFHLKECQMALIENIESEKRIVPRAKDSIPIVLAANNLYVPILTVCLQSILDTASPSTIYDIVVFHTDITKNHIEQLTRIALPYQNIRLDFVNVAKRVSGYQLQAKEHITTETFYRFLILDIMSSYKKVIYLDSDLIVKRDLSQLYNTDLGSNLIGAVKDADFQGQYNKRDSDMREYCTAILRLEKPYNYFQAGVLLINVEKLNHCITVEELFQMADTGVFRFSDQDILNVICQNRVHFLDMRWNLLTDCGGERWKNVISHAPHFLMDEYEEARKEPYIIHYAGYLKPWKKTNEDYAEEFWKIARRTEFYEVLLQEMGNFGKSSENEGAQTWDKKHPVIYWAIGKVMPLHSRRREYVKRILGIRRS